MIEKVKWRKGGKLTRAAADHVFVHFFIFHWTRDAMIFDSRLWKIQKRRKHTCTHAALTSASVRVLQRCRVSARLRTNREQRCSLFRLVISIYPALEFLSASFGFPRPLFPPWSIIVKESRVNLVVERCTISFRFLSAFHWKVAKYWEYRRRNGW